jgi:hypothetical protein
MLASAIADGSGTGLMAMAVGPSKPVISDALIGVPSKPYSPMVPLPALETYRSFPKIAMPSGLANPEISDALTVAPEVVYSPMVPLPSSRQTRRYRRSRCYSRNSTRKSGKH